MRGVEETSAPPVSASEGVSLDAQVLREMLIGAFDQVREQSSALSELDRAIGDGDHGTTMARAAAHLSERLTGPDAPRTIDAVLTGVSSDFLDVDGGATGPLFGTFFAGMAKEVDGRERLDPAALASLLEGGLRAIQGLTRAVPGDKTLLDALVPAVAAATASARQGESIASLLDVAASAAEAGAIATRDLRARHGRAKHMGDRVLGHEDPGARSVAILFRGLADEGTHLLRMEE